LGAGLAFLRVERVVDEGVRERNEGWELMGERMERAKNAYLVF
jgi:hypothetical protein